MKTEKIQIELTIDAELMLAVIARRCDYENVSELLEVIANNIELCGMIENYLKFQADDIEFF